MLRRWAGSSRRLRRPFRPSWASDRRARRRSAQAARANGGIAVVVVNERKAAPTPGPEDGGGDSSNEESCACGGVCSSLVTGGVYGPNAGARGEWLGVEAGLLIAGIRVTCLGRRVGGSRWVTRRLRVGRLLGGRRRSGDEKWVRRKSVWGVCPGGWSDCSGNSAGRSGRGASAWLLSAMLRHAGTAMKITGGILCAGYNSPMGW